MDLETIWYEVSPYMYTVVGVSGWMRAIGNLARSRNSMFG